MRKIFKKLMAVSLTVTMTMASAMVASAANDGTLSGDGDFEGTKLENPTISVKLPTTANIDYIADPNNLIQSTMSGDAALREEYKGITFEGNTGIYFPKEVSGDISSKIVKKYSNESQDLKAVNRSRQAVKITVKMEAASGDASIAYASGDAFTNSGDASRKVYFGVTDGASGDAAITAEGAAGAATFETEVAGTPANFKPAYNSGDAKYEYVEKPEASGDASWQSVTYKLKGAANQFGDWGKDKTLAFPKIKVTWSCVDPTAEAAPSIANSVTYSKGTGAALVIPHSLGGGQLGATEISDITLEVASGEFHSKNGIWGHPTDYAQYYTITDNSISISYGLMQYVTSGAHTLYVIYDGDESTAKPVTINVTD